MLSHVVRLPVSNGVMCEALTVVLRRGHVHCKEEALAAGKRE